MNHKVAILIAVYNAEKYIEPLLSSLFQQDYSNIHLYVRDNASTDYTVNLLQNWQKQFSQKMTLLLSERNEGVISNFAHLLEVAEESYVMFCDGDDVWLPHKVSSTFARMQELEKIHGISVPLLVHTDLVVVDQDLKLIAPSFWKYACLNTNPHCETLSRLLVQNHVTGCTMMINQALKSRANPIPLDCVMHDWWIALVAACFGYIDRFPVATLLYRQHCSNDTGAKKYSLFSKLGKEKKPSADLKPKKMAQTKLLLSRFEKQLMPIQRETLEAYLKMQEVSILKKIPLMLRHGFFKSGFLRNCLLNH